MTEKGVPRMVEGESVGERKRGKRGLLGSPSSAAARRASFGLPLRRDGRSFPVVAGFHVEATFSRLCC